MTNTICQSCKTSVNAGLGKCPECNAQLLASGHNLQSNSKPVNTVVVMLGAAIILGFIIYFSMGFE